MEFKNVLTICITVVFCTTIWALIVTDENDPAEIAAKRQIEQINLEKVRVKQVQMTKRVQIAASKEKDIKARQMQEMRTLVQQGVAPFAARCMVMGVGQSGQQKRCLEAGGKPVKK